jgi:hypothetical protein
MIAIVSLRMAMVAFTASIVDLIATFANLIAACAARLSIIAAFCEAFILAFAVCPGAFNSFLADGKAFLFGDGNCF